MLGSHQPPLEFRGTYFFIVDHLGTEVNAGFISDITLSDAASKARIGLQNHEEIIVSERGQRKFP